jgi:glycosyltransferase involved in cell wall biosynthesis
MKILMLGESLDRSGGIVSVQKAILNNVPSELEITLIPTLRAGSATRKILGFAWALCLLCWRLLFTEVDLVYIHVAERGSAFRQALTTTLASAFGKPVVLHSHTADFHNFYARLSPTIKRALRGAFRKADRFIVLSQSWQQYFVNEVGLDSQRVIVLPNPVKIPDRLPDRTDLHPVKLVFLGKIGDRKGAFDLIEAIEKLPAATQSQIHLTMAGDGEVDRARQLVRQLDLTEQIAILDWVDEAQRNQLLAAAAIFVLPSYNEGLPMALLEAMSWSLAAISTPVGGIPELLTSGHNGLLVSPGDIPALTAALQMTIDNPTLRQSLGAAARETVRPLEVGRYCCQLADIFDGVVTRTSAIAIGNRG